MSSIPPTDPRQRISPAAPTLDAPSGADARTPRDRSGWDDSGDERREFHEGHVVDPSSSGSLTEESYPEGAHCRVELVQGSGPELTYETQCLLRRRLRLAAALLAIGFVAFWVKSFFSPLIHAQGGTLLFTFHGLTALVLAAVATTMYVRSNAFSIAALRGLELATFGLPTVFFLLMQYVVVLACCEMGQFDFPIAPWLLMIYTYALFIPNTIRRAGIIIALMVVAPIVALLVQLAFHPEVAAMASIDGVTSFALALVLAGVSGVFGVDTIGALRRQVFAARQLGHYRLKQPIGAGGMGEVYLAEHSLLKRPCVIKLIRPERAGDSRALARFQREVRATAKLTHWNTIEIFDYGNADDGTFYYVMEYLPGMSLSEIVERFGPMPPQRAIHLIRQACDGLREAHDMGLIHRDLKPGNLFAAQRGGVYDVTKVLDFGLVKPMFQTDGDEDSLQLTTDGAITGSPLFMSPEQAVGDHKPDRRSDIYSLGAVMYYLLTARPPFEGNRPLKVMFAHAHQEPAPPSQFSPDVPDDLEQVVMRCLAKDPAERFQTVTELGAALDACESSGGWGQREATQWWRTSAGAAIAEPVG